MIKQLTFHFRDGSCFITNKRNADELVNGEWSLPCANSDDSTYMETLLSRGDAFMAQLFSIKGQPTTVSVSTL